MEDYAKKNVTQDTLKKIYLILLKISEKRSRVGLASLESRKIGSELKRYSQALGLGQFTRK